MKLLIENWRAFLKEDVALSQKEKAEVENVLRMTGFQLQNHVQMVLQMGAQPVYEKILGALLANVYGERGVERAEEILEIAPQLTPAEGEYSQDSSESVVFEDGEYLQPDEWQQVENYIKAYNSNPNKLEVAKMIERDAARKSEPMKYIDDVSDLLRRLKDYGSHRDDTRGVLLQRGGWARALKAGYIIRPEDDKKITVGDESDHSRISGTRKYGHDLLDSLKYIDLRQF